jgi:hypothetical protein
VITSARIFLAENRIPNQLAWFRTLKTDVSSTVLSVNDETLKPDHQIIHRAEQDCTVFVLPIVGAVSCLINESSNETVDVGEFMIVSLSVGETIKFANEYQQELISYLHIWIEPSNISFTTGQFTFDGHQNQLLDLFISNSVLIKIGQFDGRANHVLQTSEHATSLFSFVVEGAFEFHERLLQPRDSLLIHGQTQVEFESLSNDAIILVIESREAES